MMTIIQDHESDYIQARMNSVRHRQERELEEEKAVLDDMLSSLADSSGAYRKFLNIKLESYYKLVEQRERLIGTTKFTHQVLLKNKDRVSVGMLEYRCGMYEKILSEVRQIPR